MSAWILSALIQKRTVAPIIVLVLASNVALVQGQNPTSNSEIESGEVRTLPPTDADRITLSTNQKPAQVTPKSSANDDSCLLPPLNLTTAPVVSAGQLQIPAKAKQKYLKACAALKNQKTTDAEKYLRSAVQAFPKYAVAWVTLGQLLAAQQRTEEARSACLQGSTVDSSYVPAYLCLADIAVRAHDWDEVLKLSTHALELDPGNNAVAYEYHAAANLNLRNLVEAEKSGLRALEIDKDHREPRVYFVLAQIYEAKHEPANEAAQLREYLKYATNPDDVAMVKQYLSELEKKDGK
jgi:tetratricopeptide (TPR) repeat protein